MATIKEESIYKVGNLMVKVKKIPFGTKKVASQRHNLIVNYLKINLSAFS